MMKEIIAAVRQGIPDARSRPPGAVLEHMCCQRCGRRMGQAAQLSWKSVLSIVARGPFTACAIAEVLLTVASRWLSSGREIKREEFRKSAMLRVVETKFFNNIIILYCMSVNL